MSDERKANVSPASQQCTIGAAIASYWHESGLARYGMPYHATYVDPAAWCNYWYRKAFEVADYSFRDVLTCM